jgi:hypothetical protein
MFSTTLLIGCKRQASTMVVGLGQYIKRMILYRAYHKATFDMHIQLFISASTTETTELEVKQVKPRLKQG